MSARPLVIGIGNPDRGDDAIGRLAARRLRDEIGDAAEIVEARGETMEIAALIQGRAACILVDACVSGAPAGTIFRLDMKDAPAPRKGVELSSHGLGLAEAIELARALGTLPARCIVIAVEGGSFGAGAPPTLAAAGAVERVVERLHRELGFGKPG